MGAASYESNYFVDESSLFGGDESGSDRYKLGIKYAKENYEKLIAGMKDGETFKIVGHSEGAAFAAGIADYLSEKFGQSKNANNSVQTVLYLSPGEADEFSSPTDFTSYELYYEDDWVSPAHPLKGATYSAKLKKGGFSTAHGGTVTGEALKKLKNLIQQFINLPGVTQVETPEGVMYKQN